MKPEDKYKYRKLEPWTDELTRIKWEENIAWDPKDEADIYMLVGINADGFGDGGVMILSDKDNPTSIAGYREMMKKEIEQNIRQAFLQARGIVC